MARPDKAAAVAEITESFRASSAAVLTEYRGLSVAQLKELRRSLAGNATYAVVKNTLTKIAAREAGFDSIEALLEGPSAIAFVTGDPVEVAKGIRTFSRANPALVVKGGILDGKALDADEIRKLADLESREVLLGKLVGGLNAPAAKLAGALAAPAAQLARLFAALVAKAQEDPSILAASAGTNGAGTPAQAADEMPAPAAGTEVAGAAAEPAMPSDGTPGVEETPDTSTAEDDGAAAQAVADATDVSANTDVTGDGQATSAS